ncbi:MAG TPA: FimV/HubP family polar landmark protein [Xanthomonadales bacterium]|nr:FimV/HubP family polar landmark protein [Xanthomonadales bacterium]
MNRPLKLSLAVALALASPAAWSLGLGPIQVRSGLNEPLVAEIPVLEGAEGEAESLKANLASAEDFARVGLDVGGISVPLTFELDTNAAGKPVIRVTSNDPVKEPFVSFLVEVAWSKGRLLREYDVLLDPPNVAPAVIAAAPVAPPVQAEPLPQPEPEPIAAAPEPAPEATPEPAPTPEAVAPEPEPAPAPIEETTPVEPIAEAPPAEPEPVQIDSTPLPLEPVAEATPPPAAQTGEYGPVAAGETLWEIANATRTDTSVSMNQMMVAILRANPDAFYKDNVNALKRGAVLRIPAGDEARSLAAAEAAAEIASQNQAWAANSSPTLVADTGYSAPSTGATSSTSPSDSRVELVPPRANSGDDSGSSRTGTAGGTDTSAALKADLARAQEQLASRDAETGELRSRVQELESLKTQSDKLITLKDSEIAELQRKLAESNAMIEAERQKAEAAETARANAEAAAAASPSPSPVESIAPVEPSPSPSPIAEATPIETPVETPTPEATISPAPIEPFVETSPTPVDSPVAEASPTESPLDAAATPSDTPAEGATVTPVTESTPAPTEAIADTGDAPQPWWKSRNVVFGGSVGLILLGVLLFLFGRGRKTPAVAAGNGRASVADQFSGGVFGGGAAAAASAERDEERELIERLAEDPTNRDAHLDLLRLYYANRDADKFEAAAGALFGQVGDADDPAWLEACEMGRELSPGNPLFESAAVAPAPAGETFDFDKLDRTAEMAPPSGRSGDTAMFDFDLAREAAKPAPAPAASDFDFDLAAPSPAPAPAPAPISDATVRFEAPKLETPAPLKTEEFRVPDFTAEVRKPELEPVAAPTATSDSFFQGEDAVGTKLDLARAYLDMGDPEGARSMLQEVLNEGNETQKGEARRLLADIG